MLYKDTVEAATLNLLLRLMKDKVFKDFNLVGDTALSLQTGHRHSADIEMVTNKKTDITLLSTHLSKQYKAEGIRTFKNGIWCFIEDVKLDLLSDTSPWVEPPVTKEGIRMASLEDICILKLNTIAEEDNRFKDLVDVYTILEHRSLEELTEAYRKKYPDASLSRVQAALMDNSEGVPASLHFVGQVTTVGNLAYRFKKAFQEPKRIFETVPWQPATFKKTKGDSSPSPEKGRGKGLRG